MRKRLAGLFAAVGITGGLLVSSGAPVGAQAVSEQPFSAYGTGSVVALNALALGNTQVAGTQAAFSGGAVNSTGLTGAITSEFGQAVLPEGVGRSAYGRGAGLELGLVTPVPQNVDVNQLNLAGRAEAAAAPPSGLVTKEIPISLNPVAFASTLRGQAQAIFDPNFCPVGRPLTFGLGYAENLQLLNTLGQNADGSFAAPVLGTSTPAGTPRATSQSRTVTYMVPNGDGTFGVVSETRQTVAPIEVLGAALPIAAAVSIEVAGELVLRATATGKPGGAKIEYPGTPVLTVKLAGVQLLSLSLQDLLGQGGLPLNLAPVAELTLGTPPRAIKGNGAPAIAADGTSASAAVDAVRVKLLSLPGLMAADLAVGHMEASATAPAGGVRCRIPVSKTAEPDPVQVGQTVNYSIKIPSDGGLYNTLFNCDLVGIKATDTHETTGGPRVALSAAEPNGRIEGAKAIFDNVGSYKQGDAPINLTVRGKVSGRSGVLKDTADVTANLGNCKGGAAGEDIVRGNAAFEGGAITGKVTLTGPQVGGGTLAATGGNTTPLALGGALLVGAMALLRLRRRADASS
ncbi:MAG: hypothetical protein ACT4OS_08565 [Acidimicrobiales bacterium]